MTSIIQIIIWKVVWFLVARGSSPGGRAASGGARVRAGACVRRAAVSPRLGRDIGRADQLTRLSIAGPPLPLCSL